MRQRHATLSQMRQTHRQMVRLKIPWCVADATAKDEAAADTRTRREVSRGASVLPDAMDLRIGDSREVMADIPEASVQLVLTDPTLYGDQARASTNGSRNGRHEYPDASILSELVGTRSGNIFDGDRVSFYNGRQIRLPEVPWALREFVLNEERLRGLLHHWNREPTKLVLVLSRRSDLRGGRAGVRSLRSLSALVALAMSGTFLHCGDATTRKIAGAT